MDNKALIEKLSNDRDEITKQIEILKNKKHAIEGLLRFYTHIDGEFLPADYEVPLSNEYPTNGTWKEKVLFILTSNKRGMRSSEIVNEAFTNEPNPITLEIIEKNVSQALWSLKRDSIIDHIGKNYLIKN